MRVEIANRSGSTVGPNGTLIFLACLLATLAGASLGSQQQYPGQSDGVETAPGLDNTLASVLPPLQLRPNVEVNIREWTRILSEDIRVVGNKTNCLRNIERFYDDKATFQAFDPVKARENILGQINTLLAQHKAAVSAIASEAEKLAAAHTFVKDLKVNYTDVHRLRNELEPNSADQAIWSADSSFGTSLSGSQGSQFTSISGGTPVPGAPEWQTPIKSIVMQTNRNFGDIPVNTSMSAVHLPLPIFPGSPEIMNGIAWTEKLDNVFKRNLITYNHVHHQYYGDHLGFLRTFPAHKWRIPRSEPDLFDARVRTWYVAGASSPKDVVILVDTSGSMTGLRREIAKGVVFEILDTLTSNDHFSVLRFSETVTPVGLPKCNLKVPKLSAVLEEQCRELGQRDSLECQKYRYQSDARGQFLRDHQNLAAILEKNGSYLSDEAYRKSIYNVTNDIRDAYLLPANARNIRYLKSNFSMPTFGIANFTRALMAGFELLQAYNRTGNMGSQCNQAIMVITDGAIKPHDDLFNRYNYPNSPVRIFSYMIGREVGDITHTKAMACSNRGYYTHVINLSEVREQVQKYLPVLARPMVLAQQHPTIWTQAYGDETYQVLTDWVLEAKRRERAKIMLIEERERLSEANSTDVINIELTNIAEYDELPLVDEALKDRIICEDNISDDAMDQSLHEELDPLGYNELTCHWASRRADLLMSVVKPIYDTRNTTIYFERVLYKNIWTEKETHVRNAQLLGIAAVDLRIADVMKVAPSHLLGPGGYAILMGHNGFLMHHPDYRALLEDPFDKQSKFLKPYFAAVDLTHIEQISPRSEWDPARRRTEEAKLLKLREAAIRRQTGFDTLTVRKAIDCRRRPLTRQQVFYYGPIKDTPYSFLLALPQSYGLNRVAAKLELDKRSATYFKPSAHDLWAVHPEYKYCEGPKLSKNNSAAAILEVLRAASSPDESAYEITFADLSAISDHSPSQRSSQSVNNIVCDQDLFPSLLFDAAATLERPDGFCEANFEEDCANSRDPFGCANSPDEMRSKLANIYGLEMSFVATRSGLTRVKVYDLSVRIKKLADLFIQRHNKAIDESWYARTVEWNMRFEDATVITVPYNAYVRLIAKLRQRITQRHPALNDTRANCDPLLDGQEEGSSEEATEMATVAVSLQQARTIEEELSTVAGSGLGSPLLSVQNDEPTSQSNESADDIQAAYKVDYSQFSSFDFLDLITNSSVHVSATQTAITRRNSKQRTPVAVSGLLYDYAAFARRFLNATSLSIKTDEPQEAIVKVKVDICPGGECPTRCGFRNDTIDCLLVDNNGFIVVGEELPHIGRSLADYDESLMQSLVERKVFHEVTMIDFQAICARSDQTEQRTYSSSQISSSSLNLLHSHPFRLELARALLSNLATSASWIWSMLYSLLAIRTTLGDIDQLGVHLQMQRSVVEAQSAVANQSLLAMLPNKTYLRPCERTITLYETRPTKETNKQAADGIPEYFVTRCGCSGWYVHHFVPNTNLLMLIVNMTSACRRCDPTAATSNFVPLAPLESTSGVSSNNNSQPSGSGNKSAEEAVCTMLERDSQLYSKRLDTCYSFHPDEAQIRICGGAISAATISNTLLAICVQLVLLHQRLLGAFSHRL